MCRTMMWVDRWVVAKATNVAVVHWIGAKHIINLAFSEIVIASVQRITRTEKISIQKGNESGVGRVAQGAKSVDEHQAARRAPASANGPEIQPSLGICLKLLFSRQSGHHYV